MQKLAKAEYITAVFLYGTIGLMVRYIDLPSDVIVLCRGVLGSLFIAGFMAATGKPIEWRRIRENGRWLILSGVCLGFNWIFLFAAYRHTTVAIASLCNYLAPIILIALSPVLFHERLTARKGLCVAGAFVGIVLVSGVLTDGAAVNGLGVALGLAAAMCFVVIVICNKRIQNISAYNKALVQLLISAAAVAPYVWISNRGAALNPDLRSLGLVAVLGVVNTGVAYCMYFGPMGILPVQTVAILGYIEPVVSVISSALILQEPLSPAGVLGAVLILGAALVSEMPARKRGPRRALRKP